MGVEIESGYTLPDGTHARILHSKNSLRIENVFSSHATADGPDTSILNSLTYEKWIPFSNEVTDPSDFSTANWTKTNCTIDADGLTFDEGAATAVAHQMRQTFTFTVDIEYILSFKVDVNVANGTDYIDQVYIRASDNGSNIFWAVFDFFDNTVSDTSDNATANLTDLGNGVFECTLIFTPVNTGPGNIRFYGRDRVAGSVTYDGSNRKIKVLRSVVHESRAHLVLQPFGDNPTFDCAAIAGHNLGDSKGRALLSVRKSSANLISNSEQFGVAAWTSLNLSAVNDYAALAPDGSSYGAEMVEDTTPSATHRLRDSFSASASTTYYYSVYVKAAVGDRDVRLRMADDVSFLEDIIADMSSGTLSNTASGSFMTDVGNGWYHIGFDFTTNVGATSLDFDIELHNGASAYTGDGSSSVYIWGAQATNTSQQPYKRKPSLYANMTTFMGLTGIIEAEDNSPIFALFNQETALHSSNFEVLEVSVDRAVLPEIAVFRAGTALVMERPIYGSYVPPRYARKTELRSSYSETGEFLGRTKQRTYTESPLSWRLLSRSWLDANWYDAMRAIETEPFFVAPIPTARTDCLFGQTTQSADPIEETASGFAAVNLNIRGLGYD